MLERLFPSRPDNTFRGPRAALVLYVLVLLMRSVIAARSMFDAGSVASSADGIPLATYGEPAARAVLSLFSMLGLAQGVLCLFGWLVLVRWRSLVPLVFSLLLLLMLGGRLMARLHPIDRTAAPGSAITMGLLVATALGLVMSLVWRREGAPGSSPAD
jgi:hypothetical protein